MLQNIIHMIYTINTKNIIIIKTCLNNSKNDFIFNN